MTGPEQGEIHQIEQYRTPSEVYAAFYELYGGEVLKDVSTGMTSTGMLLDGRVLHIDETADRSTHIIVRRADIRTPAVTHLPYRGQPNHCLYYKAKDFMVVTTDGSGIEIWDVKDASGTYEGRIDTILNPYKPERETMTLSLINNSGTEKRKLEFNKATGEGTMNSYGGYGGWILKAEDSRQERNKQLAILHLGHKAIAS